MGRQALLDRLEMVLGTRSDTTFAPLEPEEPEKIDPAVLDTPDPSRMEASTRAREARDRAKARQVGGVVLLCAGGALAGGTAAIAAGLDHAGDAKWTNLGLANALGWTAVAGGATMVGASLLSEDGGVGVTVRGRF